MKFADTSYLLALLNPDDEFHSAATALSSKLDDVVVTTMWVLTELGDALHRGRNRATFARFLDTLGSHEDFEVVPARPALLSAIALLGSHEDFEVVPASAELFQRGVEFFRA